MRITKHWIHAYAPPCAIPECRNRVSYHNLYMRTDGTTGAHWKTCCEYHRDKTTGKPEVSKFKQSRGCENKDDRLGLGFKCGDPTTPSLTIDHWDGNKYNRDASNIVVLCANCHNRKTVLHGNHLTTYTYTNTHFDNLYTFEEDYND